jgi:hypothetical protein
MWSGGARAEARDPRLKDEIDLENVLPRLGAIERAWLAAATELAHPESPWRERVVGFDGS